MLLWRLRSPTSHYTTPCLSRSIHTVVIRQITEMDRLDAIWDSRLLATPKPFLLYLKRWMFEPCWFMHDTWFVNGTHKHRLGVNGYSVRKLLKLYRACISEGLDSWLRHARRCFRVELALWRRDINTQLVPSSTQQYTSVQKLILHNSNINDYGSNNNFKKQSANMVFGWGMCLHPTLNSDLHWQEW